MPCAAYAVMAYPLEGFCRHLAGEVLRAGRKLDHHIINRAEFIKGVFVVVGKGGPYPLAAAPHRPRLTSRSASRLMRHPQSMGRAGSGRSGPLLTGSAVAGRRRGWWPAGTFSMTGVASRGCEVH